MRDALQGLTRFDQFQKSLGIAPNMLTRRLNSLVDAGMLMRRRYTGRENQFIEIEQLAGLAVSQRQIDFFATVAINQRHTDALRREVLVAPGMHGYRHAAETATS